jgi:hypothetical protein
MFSRIDKGFDKRYWIYIYASVIFHTIAWILTWYAISTHRGRECIVSSAQAFDSIGFMGFYLITTFGLIAVMIFIPYFMDNNDSITLFMTILMLCAVIFTGFDAVNDIFMTINFDLGAYFTISVSRAAYNVVGQGSGFTC